MYSPGVACLSFILTLSSLPVLAQKKPAVEFMSIPKVKKYNDATTPDALRFACSNLVPDLERYFAARNLPFDPEIVRTIDTLKCHVYYEPTLPGFRALPDNQPVTELFLDVNLLSFLSRRDERFGDPLDVARDWLPKLPRPMKINLGTPLNQERKYYEQGLAYYFPSSQHTFSFRDNTWDQTNPWVQDYLKAGVAGGESKILVTRMAFEGRAENGEMFKPMLDSLSEKRFVRSKLSWEGGDLQFILSPKDPSKLLLFYGHSANNYWGEKILTPLEYAYVLKVEFGADEAIDFRDISSHVDYFVSFLPRDNIALLSEPDRENYEIARAAVTLLKNYFRNMMQPEILELDALFSNREQAYGPNLDKIRKVLKRIADKESDWPLPFSLQVGQNIEKYVQANCPQNPPDCVSPSGIADMLVKAPDLLRDWANGAVAVRSGELLTDRIVAIIQSELPGFHGTVQPIVEEKAKVLESLGFRVIRMPRLAGDPALKVDWPGVSYVNSTLIDNMLFMPAFGLGLPELRFFERLRSQLPPDYLVVPLFAQTVLLRNGGIHCISGLIRSPEAITKESAPASIRSTQLPFVSPRQAFPIN